MLRWITNGEEAESYAARIDFSDTEHRIDTPVLTSTMFFVFGKGTDFRGEV